MFKERPDTYFDGLNSPDEEKRSQTSARMKTLEEQSKQQKLPS